MIVGCSFLFELDIGKFSKSLAVNVLLGSMICFEVNFGRCCFLLVLLHSSGKSFLLFKIKMIGIQNLKKRHLTIISLHISN